MSSDCADETMDSLLKEIDDEMEHTINLDSQGTEQRKTGKPVRRWSIPLQEIGDETMEMLVSHNTIRNIKVRDSIECSGKDRALAKEAPLPTRKSVVFSEGVNLHEYANGSDNEQEDSDQESVKVDTRWKKSAFLPAIEKPNEVPQSPIVEAHSDSGGEGGNHDLDLTSQDLLKHTVTDLDQKLSYMLDNNRNTHRLKLLSEEVDELSLKKEEAAKIEYTLQATKPLSMSASDDIEAAGLIRFQTIEDATGGHGEENDEDDSASEYMNEVRHSPSKIPLTNTVNINNFSLNQESRETQTRLSSGSSCCDSVADLKTTIQHDTYNLLDSIPDLPANHEEKYCGNEEPFSHGELVTIHPNTSRIFSVATSGGEGYKSAVETANSLCSVHSNNEDCDVAPIDKSSEASIEDLDISAGLLKDEDTTYRINDDSSVDDDAADVDKERARKMTSEESETRPQIPQLPVLALQSSEALLDGASLRSSQTDSSSGKFEAAPTGFHDEQPSSRLVKDFSSRSLPEFCAVNSDQEDQESLNDNCSAAEKPSFCNADLESNSKTATEQSEKGETPSEIPLPNGSGATDGTKHTQASETENVTETESFFLPRVAHVESFFNDNPFVDDFETSGESMDLTRSVKPSNYLSIWHMQEEDIKSTSPALSSNSQFSRYTNSTDTSAANSNLGYAFKFKPRVISRSRYYYPEPKLTDSSCNDNYVITKPETALDPLRRNTLNSKRIQENIRSQRKLYSASQDVQDDNEIEINRTEEEKATPQIDQCVAENASEEPTVLSELAFNGELKNDQLQLLPSLPNVGLGEEFVTYLEAITHDNRSIFYPSHDEKVSYNVWGPDTDIDASTSPAKESVSIDVIHKLLDQENKKAEPLKEDPQHQDPINIFGVLKTPVKEVSVGRGLSLKGYEAMVSEGFGSEGKSKSLIKGSNDNDALDNLFESPSAVKKTHVDSPFKVKPRAEPVNEICSDKANIDGLPLQPPTDGTTADGWPDAEGFHTREDVCVGSSARNIPSIDEKEQKIALPNRGNLYLSLKNITDLLLHNVKHHKAQFAVEFDNGMDIVQTAWQTLTNASLCEIDREFEIILENELQKMSKLIITLKCRYESPKYQLEEVIEKVPIGRKFPFGKAKFEYQKRYVQKTPQRDDWDFLFARDGSFGRCEIVLDDTFLEGIKFRNKQLSFTMINEWARKTEPNPSQKLHELPRKPPYAIGVLNVEACYLERSSPLEKFPKTLQIARDIISKYNLQQSIFKEGYMLQEGGDIQSNFQRRFFKLQGNTMLGYHDITMQPKLAINLLKVVKVFGPGDIPKQGERNLTDLVLLSGCFHLVFDNDEKITFSTDTAEDGEDWCSKIHQVVGLNICHQPWVKYFHQSIDLDH